MKGIDQAYYLNIKVNKMRKINKIRIFANENEESYKIKLKLQGVLENINLKWLKKIMIWLLR